MSSLPLDTLSHLSPLEPTANVTPPRVNEPTDAGSFQEHLDEPQARTEDSAVSTTEEPQSGEPEASDETEPAEQTSPAESESGEEDEAEQPNEAPAVEQPIVRNGAAVALPNETFGGAPASADDATPTATAVTVEEVPVQVEQLGEASPSSEPPVEIHTSAEQTLEEASEGTESQQAAPSRPKKVANARTDQRDEKPASPTATSPQPASTDADEVAVVRREQNDTTGTKPKTGKVQSDTVEAPVPQIEALSGSSDNLGSERAARRQTDHGLQAKSPLEVEPVSAEDARSTPGETSASNGVGGTRSPRIGSPLLRGDQNSTESTDSPQQTRFVHRVTKAFEVARQRGEPIRLRLHPPELGSLRLEIKVEGNVMLARIETETQSARTLLLDNLPVLRERLAEQEIHVEQFDIDLLDRHSSAEEERRDQPSDGDPTDESPDSPERHQDNLARRIPRSVAAGSSADGNLDVRV